MVIFPSLTKLTEGLESVGRGYSQFLSFEVSQVLRFFAVSLNFSSVDCLVNVGFAKLVLLALFSMRFLTVFVFFSFFCSLIIGSLLLLGLRASTVCFLPGVPVTSSA